MSDHTEKKNREPFTLKKFLKYWLLLILVLAVIGLLTQDPSKRSTATPEASQQAKNGECDRHPVEIFPVGERFESDRLSRLIDSSCPNAKFYPDERVEVRFRGQVLFIQTKKLNYTGPAYYEIVSIRGN